VSTFFMVARLRLLKLPNSWVLHYARDITPRILNYSQGRGVARPVLRNTAGAPGQRSIMRG